MAGGGRADRTRRTRDGRRGGCGRGASGLKQANYRRENDRQQTENRVRVETGPLFGSADHLIHAIGAEYCFELIGRICALFQILQKRVDALRASGCMLLLERRFQKTSDQTGDLAGIRGRSGAALKRRNQVLQVTCLGTPGGIV